VPVTDARLLAGSPLVRNLFASREVVVADDITFRTV
jgi:hypothetical protein